MASEIQKMMDELSEAASEEKKKFVEKVKNDDHIQSMFAQLSAAADGLEIPPSIVKETPKKEIPDQIEIEEPNSEETEPNSTDVENTQVQTEGSEEQETVQQKTVVDETIEFLAKTSPDKKKLGEQAPTDFDVEYQRFKDLVTKQLASLGGGGAVNIRDMDDVDRTTALVDGKALVYRASDGKFIGGESGGGASAGVVSGEGSVDEIVLDGTDASGTDAGDQITEEIGTGDYVLGKDGYINDDGFEWVNDNDTSTTIDTANVYVTLTNARKNAGDPVSGSLSQYLPEGVTRIWDDTNDKLFFNQLQRKDWLIIRVGLKINPTVHNVRVVVRMLVTTKHSGSFPLEAPATVLGPSGAGITYDPEFLITFYVGDLDSYNTTDTYGQIQVQGDGPFVVEDFDLLTIKG